MARGPKVLVYTCTAHVITRFMKEANVTYREVEEGTGVSKSTIFGWANGVSPENADVYKVLRRYFSELLKREISTDDLLYGKDEDLLAMREFIEAQKVRIKDLENQLTIFELVERSA